MTRADIVGGLLLAAGFGAALWEAWSFQYGTEFAPGPGFAPVWLSAIGLGISLLIACAAWRSARAASSDGTTPSGAATPADKRLDKAGLTRVGSTLIALAAMIAIVPWIGFVPAILVFLLLLTLLIQRLSLLNGIGASVGTVVFVYLIFVQFLKVPIPSGPLGF